MGLEYVDIFYHHRPDPNTPLEETMSALDGIVRQGKALYIGLSNYKKEEAAKAFELLHAMGTPCIIHQPKYSMFERWVEDGLLDTLGKAGVGCIPYSPLAQGLLTNKYLEGIPADSRAAKPTGFLKEEQVTSERVSQIKRLNAIAEKRGQTLAQMALAWLLKDKRVTSVLIGASKPAQLIDSLRCQDNINFSAEELSSIEAVLQ